MSVQNFLLKKYLKVMYKPRFNGDLKLEQARKELDSVINTFMPSPCRSLGLEQQVINGVPCEVIYPEQSKPKGILLYIHGGCFSLGSPLSHRGVTCELAKTLSLTVVVPDFRLAPEHPYPAAQNDVQSVYEYLVTTQEAEHGLYIAGDQAGAGMAILLAIALRDQNKTQPQAVFGLSGLYDLTLSSKSMRTLKDIDCCNTPAVFERGIGYYLPESIEASSPEVSPLLADLSALPPILLQVSDSEMLLDDSIRLSETITEAGGMATLDVWQDVPSCWHIAAVGLPEGRTAIKRIGQFIKAINI
ncbi:alpha/beta hydrolase [Thalassotalea nanhaiensis]|uniref:Alpha/beta hydrolase n=1 Tax=Thalassotalea nanhaiensis TaxID=3065648 RepID=A0ABY9TDX9_9GAMM|nr:alpha/beta hydrolase [Colwelliaceae bacterium SQ345]